MPVDADAFRLLVGTFPAGVTIVTASDGSGPRGLTVSSFASVSLDPPLVLICVDHASDTLPAIQASGRFTVNVLTAGNGDLALAFARKKVDKFAGLTLWPEPFGCGPILGDVACAYFACAVTRTIEAGDHVLFIASVEGGEVWPDRVPMVYWRRTFGPFTPG